MEEPKWVPNIELTSHSCHAFVHNCAENCLNLPKIVSSAENPLEHKVDQASVAPPGIPALKAYWKGILLHSGNGFMIQRNVFEGTGGHLVALEAMQISVLAFAPLKKLAHKATDGPSASMISWICSS